MEQKTWNRIRFVLFLFLFGFIIVAYGLGSALQDLSFDGIIGLLMVVVGVLCVFLGIYLVRKNWL